MITRRDQWTAYVVLGLFSLLALYPVLGILGLAMHTKDDQITGFALPTTFSLDTFAKAWTDGNFATGLWSSFIVAVAVHPGEVLTDVVRSLPAPVVKLYRMLMSTLLLTMLMLTFLLPVQQLIYQRMKMAAKWRIFISRTTTEYVLDAEHLVLNWTCLRPTGTSRSPADPPLLGPCPFSKGRGGTG